MDLDTFASALLDDNVVHSETSVGGPSFEDDVDPARLARPTATFQFHLAEIPVGSIQLAHSERPNFYSAKRVSWTSTIRTIIRTAIPWLDAEF